MQTQYDQLKLSYGQLDASFSGDYGFRLVVNVDPDIARYARWLIPTEYGVKGSRYPPHISVVRYENVSDYKKFISYDRKWVAFKYDPYIGNDDKYWWHNVYSKKLDAIRKDLGLPLHNRLSMPPDGRHCFHLTVGNTK